MQVLLLIDDLDGGEAADTVRFSLDGTEHEIDLSASAQRRAAQGTGPVPRYSRRVRGSASSAARGRRGAAVDTAKAREWAKGHGIEVKDRGGVPADVVKRYKAAAGA
jgi:hypothetical protein